MSFSAQLIIQTKKACLQSRRRQDVRQRLMLEGISVPGKELGITNVTMENGVGSITMETFGRLQASDIWRMAGRTGMFSKLEGVVIAMFIRVAQKEVGGKGFQSHD